MKISVFESLKRGRENGDYEWSVVHSRQWNYKQQNRSANLTDFLKISLTNPADRWAFKPQLYFDWIPIDMSRLTTKPTKWLCAQRRLRSAWASAHAVLLVLSWGDSNILFTLSICIQIDTYITSARVLSVRETILILKWRRRFFLTVLLYVVFVACYEWPSSQAKGTKFTSFLTHKERSELSTLGLRRWWMTDQCGSKSVVLDLIWNLGEDGAGCCAGCLLMCQRFVVSRFTTHLLVR